MKVLILILLFPLAVSASGEIYRWRDGAGVFHFSNSLDDVPLRFRDKVTVMNYGPAQQDGAAPAQVSPPAAVPPAPGISQPQRAHGGAVESSGTRVHRQRRGVRSAAEDREE